MKTSILRPPVAVAARRSPGRTGRGRTIALRALLAILGAWLVVLVLHQASIGGTWEPVGLETWLWLIAWVIALTVSYLVGIGGPQAVLSAAPVDSYSKACNRMILSLSGLIVAAVALFVFDFAVLRGYGFFNAAAAIRAEEVNAAITGAGSSGSSLFSGIARLLIPAFLPSTVLAVLSWRLLHRRARVAFMAMLVLLAGQQLLFEGGRFLITSAVVAAVFAFLVFPGSAQPTRARKRKPLPYVRLALLGALLLSFFAYVFIDRVLERGDYFSTAYLQLASSFQITPHYNQLDWFEGPLGGLWFSVCMLWLYATQGINELDLILNQPYLEHAYGLYQLPHIGQAILVLTGLDLRYDALANLPTYGSYATLYGHSFVDFGNAGSIIQALAMGYFTGRGIHLLSNGQLGPLAMMAPILFTMCLFSPVISLVPTIWPALFWAAVAGWALRQKGAAR